MDNLSAVLDYGRDNDGLSLQQSNQLLQVQKEILEIVITGGDYQKALDSLCLAAESILPDSLASIMLFNDDKSCLSVRSAPNIPPEAIHQLNGLKPGNNQGSCGTAVFRGEPQFVVDTFEDIRWNQLVPFAQDFNIRACWSQPIKDPKNIVFGSFALSSFSCRKPTHFQRSLMQIAASLTSLILQREEVDSQIQKVAFFDELTNLPNRTLFTRRAEQALSRAKRHRGDMALLFIDLDNFKAVNDEFGHKVGDKVLAIAAQRMLDCIRIEDTLARLGGDEFVLLVEGVGDLRELNLIALKLLTAFEKPISTADSSFVIGGSIGISLYPNDADTIDALIEKADKAMYRAKKAASKSIVANHVKFAT